MANTPYTRSITTDFIASGGGFNLESWIDEIYDSAIVTALDLNNTNRDGDIVTTMFKDSLSVGDVAIFDGLVAAHTGEESDLVGDLITTAVTTAEGGLVFAPTFEETEGLAPQWISHLYTATAGVTNIYDELVTSEKRLRGGWYELFDSNAVIGDYVEFAVVDKDDTLGLFSTYGLTVGQHVLELRKYVKTDYVKPDDKNRQEFKGASAFQVIAGLYIRSIYVSTGSNDVQFKVVTLCYE